jgi:Ca2+-binding RTX toxin-like protein
MGALIGVAAIPATAAPTCGFAAGVVSVGLPAGGDEARVVVGTGADDGKILFAIGSAAPASCGTATVANTDTVVATGGAGDQLFRVSLAGGAFAPGATAEATGTAEIEFQVDLGDGAGDQVVVAGDGTNDTVVAGTDGVNVNAAEDPDDVDVSISGVEELALEGAAGDDHLSGAGGQGTGSAIAAVRLSLRGGDGADVLAGGPGNDVVNGGAGADQMDGGPGVDTVSYFGAPAGVVVSLAAGTSSGADGSDSLTGFENITGSAFDDELTGDESANAINGLGGADQIDGSGGVDAVRYLLAGSSVTVDLAAGLASGGDGADTLRGIENVLGSDFDDVIRGDAGPNQLIGGAGDDTISAGDGVDRLLGSSGDDRLQGGDGNDGVSGQGGDDVLRGGRDNDGLRGGGGADTLLGGQGNDALRGGPSTDTCNGGPGSNEIRSCER